MKLVPFWNEVVPSASAPGSPAPRSRSKAGIFPPLLGTSCVRARGGTNESLGAGPSSPGSCSEDLLTKLSDLSRSDDLPTYTHIYESKAMTFMPATTTPEMAGRW